MIRLNKITGEAIYKQIIKEKQSLLNFSCLQHWRAFSSCKIFIDEKKLFWRKKTVTNFISIYYEPHSFNMSQWSRSGCSWPGSGTGSNPQKVKTGPELDPIFEKKKKNGYGSGSDLWKEKKNGSDLWKEKQTRISIRPLKRKRKTDANLVPTLEMKKRIWI